MGKMIDLSRLSIDDIQSMRSGYLDTIYLLRESDGPENERVSHYEQLVALCDEEIERRKAEAA